MRRVEEDKCEGDEGYDKKFNPEEVKYADKMSYIIIYDNYRWTRRRWQGS